MQTKSCQKWLEIMLDDPRDSKLKAHLQGCANCSEAFPVYEEILNSYNFEQEVLIDSAHKDTVKALCVETLKKDLAPHRFALPVQLGSWGLAAAVVLAIFLNVDQYTPPHPQKSAGHL